MTKLGTDVEYDRDDPYDYRWTEEAFDEIKAGRLRRRLIVHDGTVLAARVDGYCPRCQHPLSFSLPLAGVVAAGGVLGRETVTPGTTYQVDVPCGCQQAHRNAPSHVTGCGIWFRVELKVGRDG